MSAPLSPVCCDPCRGMSLCESDRSCCLECHFGFEEEAAFPYLPMQWQQRLRQEHAWLVANRFPPDQVAAHAAWEDAVFRRHCPAWLCDLFERDHKAHQNGRLISRVQMPTRHNGMFSPRWQTARV